MWFVFSTLGHTEYLESIMCAFLNYYPLILKGQTSLEPKPHQALMLFSFFYLQLHTDAGDVLTR